MMVYTNAKLKMREEDFTNQGTLLYSLVLLLRTSLHQRNGHGIKDLSNSAAQVRSIVTIHSHWINIPATAIPNATVSWWYNGKELGKQDLDRNFVIKGHGPSTDLTVTPLKSEYYGKYRCQAENPLGHVFHEIELKEAHE